MNSPHLGLPGPSCWMSFVLEGQTFLKIFLANCTTPCEISGLNVIARHYEGPSQQDLHFRLDRLVNQYFTQPGKIFLVPPDTKTIHGIGTFNRLPTSNNSQHGSKYTMDGFSETKYFLPQSVVPLCFLHQTCLGNKNLGALAVRVVMAFRLFSWMWKDHRLHREGKLTGNCHGYFSNTNLWYFWCIFVSWNFVGKPDASLYRLVQMELGVPGSLGLSCRQLRSGWKSVTLTSSVWSMFHQRDVRSDLHRYEKRPYWDDFYRQVAKVSSFDFRLTSHLRFGCILRQEGVTKKADMGEKIGWSPCFNMFQYYDQIYSDLCVFN